MPKTRRPRPRVIKNAPGISSLRLPPSPQLSGTNKKEIAITAAAIGRLMKKTQRQERCWTSHPPRTGPIAAVIPVKPDHVPIALPRWSAGNAALMIARLPGTSMAPPTPCKARAAIRCRISGAKPHQADDAAKRNTPIVNTRRRP